MHDANGKGSAVNEATHCLPPALPLLVREQADWPRPSKEWPGIQKLQAALSLPSKINQNNNRQIRQRGDTPIGTRDEAIR